MSDHSLPDHHVGPRGEARRVEPERLRAALIGDTMATLDYWWLHLPGQAIIVAHAGAEPTDMAAVQALEVLVPEPGQGMDTFAMGLITLADIPGVPPANKAWPWVTHELLVQTVDTSNGPWGEKHYDASDGKRVSRVFHWVLEDVSRLAEPIEAKGRLGLWTPDPELKVRILMGRLEGSLAMAQASKPEGHR